MAGNTSADENIDSNKSAEIVSEFLLDHNIRDTCTLDEMRSNFPSKYRSHNDITVLYESFVVKRKLLKEAVRKNIEEFYAKDRVKSNKIGKQNIEEKIAVLDLKRMQLRKEMVDAKKELSILQKNIVRCNEAVKDCHLLKNDIKEYFDMELFEGIGADE